MTTRNFSPISLPHTCHTLTLGTIDLRKENLRLESWLPDFSKGAQLIEVSKEGQIVYGKELDNARKLTTNYLNIDLVRPELFLRRDFIKKFIQNGRVHLVSYREGAPYHLSITNDNILTILLTEEQYRRFGLITHKVISKPKQNIKLYKIEIDLKNAKILDSNKFQDKMIQTLRRLEPIRQVYFRFVPDDAFNELSDKTKSAMEICSEFFHYVIEEYAIDGFKPIPLAGCSLASSRVTRKWTNYAQPMPVLINSLSLDGDEETLGKVTDLLDWLGFQVLSLDMSKDEKLTQNSQVSDDTCDMSKPALVDVACCEVSGGLIDSSHLVDTLRYVFQTESQIKESDTDQKIFQSLILHGQDDQVSGFISSKTDSLIYSWSITG